MKNLRIYMINKSFKDLPEFIQDRRFFLETWDIGFIVDFDFDSSDMSDEDCGTLMDYLMSCIERLSATMRMRNEAYIEIYNPWTDPRFDAQNNCWWMPKCFENWEPKQVETQK